jgi:hypothetical protein
MMSKAAIDNMHKANLRLIRNYNALLRVARAARAYRESSTNWSMYEYDQEELANADGRRLDEALKEVKHLL